MNRYFQIIPYFSINVCFISHHDFVLFTFSLMYVLETTLLWWERRWKGTFYHADLALFPLPWKCDGTCM